ncbi:MAG: hypothetical protein HYW90_00690 [Candidatus Sungbacteria bacterium]|nr:hypothetical protein [Candidatus Sungbacteria bacterium]
MPFVFLYRYLLWHYSDGLKASFNKAVNAVIGFLNFFSVLHLFGTLFSPWHRVIESYGRGFDAARFFYAITGNAISRLLGALLRSFVIVVGIAAAALSVIAGVFFIFLWIFLPFLVPLLFITGIIFLFA